MEITEIIMSGILRMNWIGVERRLTFGRWLLLITNSGLSRDSRKVSGNHGHCKENRLRNNPGRVVGEY